MCNVRPRSTPDDEMSRHNYVCQQEVETARQLVDQSTFIRSAVSPPAAWGHGRHLLRQFQRRGALLHALWTAAPRLSRYMYRYGRSAAVSVRQAFTHMAEAAPRLTQWRPCAGWPRNWAAASSRGPSTCEGWIEGHLEQGWKGVRTIGVSPHVCAPFKWLQDLCCEMALVPFAGVLIVIYLAVGEVRCGIERFYTC
jgi:hypothetical protein